MRTDGRVSACPVCRSETAGTFFRMEGVPVFANVLSDTAEAARAAPRGDVELAWCAACGMVWNARFDPSLVEYAMGYENSLFFSARFTEYATELAADLVERYELEGKTAVEIGCGDGRFLAGLLEHGLGKAVGYDPSFPGEPLPGVELHAVPYSEEQAREPFDLLVCRHVLEHLAEPRAFLESVRRGIGDRAVHLYFEVPSGLWTLEDKGIWDVIYEHCSYFTPAALTRLFTDCGFEPLDVRTRYGGQFLSIEARPGEASEPVFDPAALRALTATYQDEFQAKVRSFRERLEMQTGVVWGAGSKGVTFVNVLEDRSASIRGIVDISPRKQGRFVPCTGHEVLSPESLAKAPTPLVILMNPVYRAEVRALLEELRVTSEVVLG